MLSAALLLSTGVAVVTPQVLRRFIDSARAGATLSHLLTLGAAYLLAAVVAELIWIGSEYLGATLSWEATNELRGDLAAHCLALDMSFYEKHPPGSLIERIDGDVGKLASFLSDMFVLLAFNILLLFGIGVALFVQDWRIGLCYVPFVVLSALLLRRLVGVALPANVAQRKAVAGLLGYLEERFSALPDMSANGAAPYVGQGFWLRAAGLLTASRRAAQLSVRWPAAVQALASAGLILALCAGAGLYLTGRTTLGGAYVLLAYAGMLQMPLMSVVFQVRALEEAVGAMRRIASLFTEHGTVPDGPGELERTPGGVEVVLDGVGHHYRSDQAVLRDVSLRIRPGRRLAVVGRTGAGKSTLAKLLFRFTDPAEGRILFDGRDLREFTVDSVRARVALVTQEVHVFHASVRDNVTLFDPVVPDETVERAVRDAGLGEWLADLPDGLDTLLGAGATGLSAGEAQLLAFSRALISDPGFVILDEASSRLDPASRRRFDDALRNLLAGRTAVIIAHQRDALRSADDVVVLDEGRVVEQGPVAVLAGDPGSALSRLLLPASALAEESR